MKFGVNVEHLFVAELVKTWRHCESLRLYLQNVTCTDRMCAWFLKLNVTSRYVVYTARNPCSGEVRFVSRVSELSVTSNVASKHACQAS